ncbi:MAG TPA: hypothetical protein PKM73_08690 [Verrucomicrobiota bacterium]|nr:hypothetical protein [Verrucomicrobiota bacterium]HNU52445.1 hypothetical protein [Verrucomicrobiota bacterium]
MKTDRTRRQFLVGATAGAFGFFLSTRRGFVTAAAANEELRVCAKITSDFGGSASEPNPLQQNRNWFLHRPLTSRSSV